jgi:hypothetical protein
MYPVKLGFDAAIVRLESLLKYEFFSESLVTTVFTVEKTLLRTLRQLIISTGFSSNITNLMLKTIRGLEAIKKNWEFFDPAHRKLTEIIPERDWEIIKNNSEIRNNLVHGSRTYKSELCKNQTIELIQTLKNVKNIFESEYGYSGWTNISKRNKSVLHVDPKVKK